MADFEDIQKEIDQMSLASDPGRFTVSQEKLKYLRPDLYSSPSLWRSVKKIFHRWPEMQIIEDHMKNGDTRAAVVALTSPLRIAAYTDELDCVAMLELTEEFVQKYALSVGTRLLTVNSYKNESSPDSDLLPGPENKKHWSGFFPIIAEFLTDDLEKVETRKRQIDEREWERAFEMGQDYLKKKGGLARDGRPCESFRPATKPHFALVVFCLVMSLGAVATEIFTVNMFLKAREIATWPTTRGIVQESEARSVPGDSSYSAHVRYEYTVADKSYVSSNIRTRGTNSKYESDAKAIAAKYPVGSEVAVHYNGLTPSEAFLEAGADLISYVLIVTPVLAALIFGFGFFELLKMRRKTVLKV